MGAEQSAIAQCGVAAKYAQVVQVGHGVSSSILTDVLSPGQCQ
jgi:hypothetical protein